MYTLQINKIAEKIEEKMGYGAGFRVRRPVHTERGEVCDT